MKKDFFNRHFDLLDRKNDKILLITIVFVFSTFFLNIFEPWNIGRWYSDSGIIQFLRLSSYGFVVALVFLFTQFPLRKLFKTTRFTIKTYGFWLITEIGLISLVYIFLYGNPLGNFLNDFLFSLKYTILGICLPYSFGILIIYYRKQNEEIKQLQTSVAKPSENKLISFRDENGKIRFSALTKDLLFLESTDNYVSVYYLSENKVKRLLLRNTLKNLEEELKNHGIMRCHRSFMVNTQNIEFMKKSGKKLILTMKQFDNNIPVSQKYSTLFLDFLS